MLKHLLKKARACGASDLHLAVGYYPVARINGELRYLEDQKTMLMTPRQRLVAENKLMYGQKLDKDTLSRCLGEIATPGNMNDLEQRGEVDFALEDEESCRYRVNVYREKENYALAIRIIPKDIPSCEALGIPIAVQRLMEAKHGLILVTGPTGSGKSTTLAALVQSINTCKREHIITLEDPVEYKYSQGVSLINQREIGSDTCSFASGLRSALREDPDVILVGELRDADSVRVALQAAETGHLVMSTLHTGTAVHTVNRLLDMLPEEKEQTRALLADNLLGIISQRLLRRKNGEGRVAAMEILLNNSAVSNLIREGRTHQLYSYMQTGVRFGMQTMETGINKLRLQKII